jgi:N-acetyl-gamma-glutamyl-phosphate reductase
MNLKRIGLVGARGHVGQELLRLIASHGELELDFVVSREWAGQEVVVDESRPFSLLRYEDLGPEAIAKRTVDAVILALPNGRAAEYVHALDAAGRDPVLVDLSADYRFDDRWYYGLPELTRFSASGQRRISNPGCYATAMQLALAPISDLLEGPVQCFGVSGYSGAGTTPGDRNDPFKLRDNLMPYSLVGHVHEREVTHHLAHPVEFMPAVAPHFRGITMTVNAHLATRCDVETVYERFRDRYDNEPLISVREDVPWVSHIADKHGVLIGGITLSADGRRAVIVSVLDNLLKGAATQAIQNLNLALGFDELRGIDL